MLWGIAICTCDANYSKVVQEDAAQKDAATGMLEERVQVRVVHGCTECYGAFTYDMRTSAARSAVLPLLLTSPSA